MVAFERYMLADDRPEYPMTFVMAVQLAGEIDRAAMEESLREALGRNPLLRAVVDRTIARGPCWVSAGENPVEFDWDMEAAPLDCPGGEAIDLATQPGLRAWARQGARTQQGESRTELTFQFHHACCDGIGAMCFIGDVLGAYGIRTARGDERPVPQPLDAQRLHERAALGRPDESALGRLGALLRVLPLTLKFFRRHPRPLAPGRTASRNASQEPTTPLPFPGIKRVVLSEACTKELHDASRRQGVTLNDLLLRDMFLTVADWNERASASPRHGWLRILMPMNLRGVEDDAMPAANLVSLSFLTRRAEECRRPRRLLAGIHSETSSIKRIRRGLYFIRVIEATLALCGKIPRLLVGRRCRATVVFSNMGDIGHWFSKTFPCRGGRIVVGNLMLEGITAAPPIRPNTTAAVLVYSYAQRLNVNVLCDLRVFSPRQAEELLRDYTQRLQETSVAADDSHS